MANDISGIGVGDYKKRTPVSFSHENKTYIKCQKAQNLFAELKDLQGIALVYTIVANYFILFLYLI